MIRSAHMRKLELAADRFATGWAVICGLALLSGQTGNGLPRGKLRCYGSPSRPLTKLRPKLDPLPSDGSPESSDKK